MTSQSPLSCKELVELVTEYLDGAMSEPERARFDAHLGICPPCVEYVAQIGRTIQAVGAGMLFTPLSTIGFSTLAPERRTDAAGLYSLLRQLGSASGVALMTAVLRVKLDAHTSGLASADGAIPAAASLQAYAECFRTMAIAALIVSPGIFLFRPSAEASQIKKAA